MASPEPRYEDLVNKIIRQNNRRKRRITYLYSTILGLLIVGVVSIFITWLVLRPHKPRYYVEYASYPQLNLTERLLSSRIELNVTTRNPNGRIGIYYRDMEGFIYHGDERIAGSYIGSFYQGHKDVRVLQPILTAHFVILRKDVARDLKLEYLSGAMALRLKLYAKVRFRIGSWKSGHYNMRVQCHQLNVDRNTGGNFFNHRRCSVYF